MALVCPFLQKTLYLLIHTLELTPQEHSFSQIEYKLLHLLFLCFWKITVKKHTTLSRIVLRYFEQKKKNFAIKSERNFISNISDRRQIPGYEKPQMHAERTVPFCAENWDFYIILQACVCLSTLGKCSQPRQPQPITDERWCLRI